MQSPEAVGNGSPSEKIHIDFVGPIAFPVDPGKSQEQGDSDQDPEPAGGRMESGE